MHVEPAINGEIPKINRSGLEYYWRKQVYPVIERIMKFLVEKNVLVGLKEDLFVNTEGKQQLLDFSS